MAERQVRKIEIVASAKGIPEVKEMTKTFTALNRSVNDGNKVLRNFRNSFLALQGLSFAGFGLREFVTALDSVQRLGDRLRSTEGSATAAAFAFEGLAKVASNNFSTIEDTGVIYNRLNLSLRELGLGTSQLLSITDLLQKSFRITGATASEATGAIIQLSQGLAAGQLRGQELRSVTESNAVLAGALAKEFGIARGELLKFSEKRGGFSPVEVIQALGGSFDDITNQASKLGVTIGGALDKNFNELKVRLFAVNEELGITTKLVGLIDFAFQSIDIALIGVGLVGAFVAYNKAVVLATGSTVAFSGTLTTLAATPAVKTIVALGAAIAALPLGVAAVAVGLGAVTAGAIGLAVAGEDTTKSVQEFLGTSEKAEKTTRSLTQRYYDQVEAAKQLKNAIVPFNLAQNQATAGLQDTINAFQKVTPSALIFERQFGSLNGTYQEGAGPLREYSLALRNFSDGLNLTSKKTFDFKAELTELNRQFGLTGATSAYTNKLKELQRIDLKRQFDEGGISRDEYFKKLNEINIGKAQSRIQSIRGELAQLNEQFGQNGNVILYAQALQKINLERINKDYKEGRINQDQFLKGLEQAKITDYNRSLAMGTMSLREFNQQVENSKLQELNRQFQTGAIDLYEYNQQLNQISETFSPNSAFFQGTADYIKQAGTISQNISTAVTNTFGNLETSFVEFTRTGKFLFKDFAAAVIDDINKIIVRALIIRPIAQGILGSFGSSDTTNGGQSFGGRSTEFQGLQAAKGAAFSGGVRMFASGGVVDRPTAFTYGNKKLGVMGEAGSEAILPLKRGANGDLGVQASGNGGGNVYVNITNNSDARVEQRETTNQRGDKFLEVVIVQAVKEGLANGSFDRQFNDQFNLRRRGR